MLGRGPEHCWIDDYSRATYQEDFTNTWKYWSMTNIKKGGKEALRCSVLNQNPHTGCFFVWFFGCFFLLHFFGCIYWVNYFLGLIIFLFCLYLHNFKITDFTFNLIPLMHSIAYRSTYTNQL